MDPHQIHNNLNANPNSQLHQAALMQQQQNYNLFVPQQAQPQQYLQQFYQAPQVNAPMMPVDNQLFQQQQLFFNMQANPQLYQQQHQQMLLQQRMHQQEQAQAQALQQATLQQQQQQQQQARMLEQQNRQIAAARMEQERQLRAQQEQEMRILMQKQQEEAAKRQAELERQRREEEMARKAAEEERRKREEQERRDMELMRIHNLEMQKRHEADMALQEMKKRASSITRPVSVVGCMNLTRLTSVVPFPSDNVFTASMASVSDSSSMMAKLSSFTPEAISCIIDALRGIDVSEVNVRGDSDEAPIKDLPPLIQAIQDVDDKALQVDEEIQNLMSAFSDHVEDDHHMVASTSSASEPPSAPRPSTASPATTKPGYVPPVRDEATMRKIVSLGKQPKAQGGGNNRKKRDMVESLFDSLTDYFDPSDGRRRRLKVKTYEEEQEVKRDLEKIAAMEAMQSSHDPHSGSDNEVSFEGKFFEKKKQRKKEKEVERPPTPTEIIQMRDKEYAERERKRHEKRRKRQNSGDNWSNDIRAENESVAKCSQLVDQIVDSVDLDPNEVEDDSELSSEMLIDKAVMDELLSQVQKLKLYGKMNEIPCERLIKLLTLLERNIRDVIAQDGSPPLVPFVDEDACDEESDTLRELVDDRLSRAADAACVALMTMTSAKMPKQVFIEDTIERTIQMCKQYLNYIIFPASDVVFAGGRGKKNDEPRNKKRKMGGFARTPIVQTLYDRVIACMGCFSELARTQGLPETFYYHMATISVNSFFVNNVGELQLKAMAVLTNIFSRADESVRDSVLSDLLNSFHKMPTTKTSSNSYRLSNDVWISNCTCLVMMMIQSVIKIPKRRKKQDDDEGGDPLDYSKQDSIVRDSYKEMQALAGKFLLAFLNKCAMKGEDDFRRSFDSFLHDLLSCLMYPEWPAAELILSCLGVTLSGIYSNRQKGVEMTLRQSALEYLGLICARLRKEKKEASEQSAARLNAIVKTLLLYESDDPSLTLDDIDVSHLSTSDLLKKAEQALIDYLVEEKSDSELSIEYAVMFYIGEWYKMTMEDLEGMKEKMRQLKKTAETDKDRRKHERKWEKSLEKGNAMKEFLIKMADKKHIRKRSEQVKKLGSLMLNSDVLWLIRFLALQRDFCNSFDTYLKHILVGVTAEQAVGLRTKAMKCLTQIIEVDQSVLIMREVRSAVNARMTDPNAQVREATIELFGKFLLQRPEFIEDYYQIFVERIKDSGTSVRKRVIRIIRDYCEKQPDYPKVPEMLSRIARRIVDEDGVKKLVLETFQSTWLHPVRSEVELTRKVTTMTQMVALCVQEGAFEHAEQLLASLLKTDDKNTLYAASQVVDCLVDSVLAIEAKIAEHTDGGEGMDEEAIRQQAATTKKNQEKLLASLTTLSLFSKVRPEMLVKHAETLQPYLSMTATTPNEQNVLNQVIVMLERVLPLLNHPSDSFVENVDQSLCNLLIRSGMTIIASAVSCASALHRKSPKHRPAMATQFLNYLRSLNVMKGNLEKVPNYQIEATKLPTMQRCVYSLGLLARFFDFDNILADEPGLSSYVVPVNLPRVESQLEVDEDAEQPRRVRDNVFVVLMFFSGYRDPGMRHKALIAMGHLCAEYAEYLQRPEITKSYGLFLKSNEPQYHTLKIQILKNLELFLTNEEKKMTKSNLEWHKSKETQDLKDMELAGSGLGSAIIQIYWPMVLSCYFHRDETVRTASMQVVWLTLSQGLVTPGSSISVLIAMSTDPLVAIRNKVENLVKDIDAKYAGMVQSKAVYGVRMAYKLQSLMRGTGELIRGIRPVDQSATANTAGKELAMTGYGVPRWTNDGQAVLSSLYASLRTSRMQRRSVLSSMLRLFSEECREKLEIAEWIFVADNIAMFPYQVLDEPLYVIHSIDSIVSLSGQSIINQFKQQLFPFQVPVGMQEDEDFEFEPHNLIQRLPEDKSILFDLMDNSEACFTLLYLKAFLMKLYGLTEAKVQEYSPSEAAKVYEKGVSRRNVQTFLPHTAIQQLHPDVRAQRNTPQGCKQLVEHISQFRRMLLSMDRVEEDEDEKEANPPPQEENDAEEEMDDE